jgi:hypothetical protein
LIILRSHAEVLRKELTQIQTSELSIAAVRCQLRPSSTLQTNENDVDSRIDESSVKEAVYWTEMNVSSRGIDLIWTIGATIVVGVVPHTIEQVALHILACRND